MVDVIEIDAATGEVTERDFTPDEAAQRAADEQAAADASAAAEAARVARESALRKIAEASGLSAEELAAIGLAV